MKLQAITGATLFEATKNVIKSIDREDKTTDYFVVVPDRFTLQAEDLVFDLLGISSTFNINVISLSSFVIKFLLEAGEKINPISPLESILQIKNILDRNKASLKFYKKNNPLFCNELYSTINQLKSSCVRPEEVIYSGDRISLRNKFEDIALVYKEYETAISERTDSSDLLSLFCEREDIKNLLHGAEVIFAGFDSFTEANYAVIKACVKAAACVKVGLATSLGFGNDYIFEKDILEKLEKLMTEEGIMLEVISPKPAQNKNQFAITTNLFSTNVKQIESNYLSVISASDIKREVEFVANSIRYGVFHGARFKSYTLACDVEAYKAEIERTFREQEIPFYIDSQENCKSSILIKLIGKLFDLKLKNFLTADILYVLDCPLLDLKDRKTKLTFVNEKQISGRGNFAKYIGEEQILQTIEQIDRCEKLSDFCGVVRGIIVSCEERYAHYLQQLEDRFFLKEKCIEEQVCPLLDNLLSMLEAQDREASLKEFLELFNLGVSFKQISALPAFCDAVFVGDISKTYFSENKTMFVLGANRGKLPISVFDTALLSDRDLKRAGLSDRVGPTIKMINRRNRFKLFNILTLATDRLIVCYQNKDEDGNISDKAAFVRNLLKIFRQNDEDVINAANFINFDNEFDFNRFLFSLGTRKTAKLKLCQFLKDRNIDRQALGSLQAVLKCDFESLSLSRDKLKSDCKKVYFPNDCFRTTEIEGYFSCPFKHFVSYALRLKEKEQVELKANELGSFYHALLERFVNSFKENLAKVSEYELEQFLAITIPKLIGEERLEFARDSQLILHFLQLDSKKLCQKLIYESKNTLFKPLLLEHKVEDTNSFSYNGILKLRGTVDRVDYYNDSFRIIDYKTGRITNNLLEDVYYGLKLQLFLYSRALENGEKTLSGVYYFDAKSSYENNKKGYILSGKTIDKESVALATDTRLEESATSDIFAARKLKSGKIKFPSLSKEEFISWQDYAVQLTQNALKDICEGNIIPSPTQDACTYCAYRGICLYDSKNGVRKMSMLEGGEE